MDCSGERHILKDFASRILGCKHYNMIIDW